MRLKRRFAILIAAVVIISCAPPPAQIGPDALKAFNKHQVQKNLDLFRDIVVDANAVGLVDVEFTRKVVKYHRSAITIVHDTDDWKTFVLSGADELQRDVPQNFSAAIGPYITLIHIIVERVTNATPGPTTTGRGQ